MWHVKESSLGTNSAEHCSKFNPPTTQHISMAWPHSKRNYTSWELRNKDLILDTEEREEKSDQYLQRVTKMFKTNRRKRCNLVILKFVTWSCISMYSVYIYIYNDAVLGHQFIPHWLKGKCTGAHYLDISKSGRNKTNKRKYSASKSIYN